MKIRLIQTDGIEYVWINQKRAWSYEIMAKRLDGPVERFGFRVQKIGHLGKSNKATMYCNENGQATKPINYKATALCSIGATLMGVVMTQRAIYGDVIVTEPDDKPSVCKNSKDFALHYQE